VVAPLAVVVGETAPHGAAGQVTIQLTPKFELSLVTVAESCAVEPGCTVAGAAPIVTTGGCCTLLLPHPASVFANANPTSDTANHFKLFKTNLRGALEMSRLPGFRLGDFVSRMLRLSCPQHNDFPARVSVNRGNKSSDRGKGILPPHTALSKRAWERGCFTGWPACSNSQTGVLDLNPSFGLTDTQEVELEIF
jgi:hypothetical protein